MENRPIWMMLTEIGTIISVMIGLGAYLLHEIRSLSDRTDRLIEGQTQRTDRLYEMFIDLLNREKK